MQGVIKAPQLILMNSQSWKILLWRLKPQQELGGQLQESLARWRKWGGHRKVGLLACKHLPSLCFLPLLAVTCVFSLFYFLPTNPSTSQILISKRKKLSKLKINNSSYIPQKTEVTRQSSPWKLERQEKTESQPTRSTSPQREPIPVGTLQCKWQIAGGSGWTSLS